jgi:hypothetical protein
MRISVARPKSVRKYDPSDHAAIARFEDEWTFCIVYECAYFDGRLGLRRTTLDAQHPGRFCDMYDDDLMAAAQTTRFGKDVADFDIGERLGAVAGHLHGAPDGISWWGSSRTT